MANLTASLTSLVLTDADFKRIAEAVYKHCGIHLTDAKKPMVSGRLTKRLMATKSKSFKEYLDKVLSNINSDEFTTFIDSLSTNLTSFFRENDHFEFLKKTFLPDHVASKSTGKKSVRCWSAGCSTGEEPYTIAMTLLENLPGASSWDINILASDISTKVLGKATAGLYESDKLVAVSPQLKAKYFEPRKLVDGKDGFAVKPAVRQLITFKQVNLMEQWAHSGPMDFIFCRNVMIYFDKPTQEKLVNRYYELLRPGGIFFTGHSESLMGIKHPFKYVQATVYRK